MSTRRATEGKRRYQYNWSMVAGSQGEQGAHFLEQANQVSWVSDEQVAEVPIEETMAVMTSAKGPTGDTKGGVVAESHTDVSVVPIVDDTTLDAFRSSPKSKWNSGRAGLLSNNVGTLSIMAWSGLAVGGVALALTGPASLLSERLAEVGGVWAAVAAAIWLLTTRLNS